MKETWEYWLEKCLTCKYSYNDPEGPTVLSCKLKGCYYQKAEKDKSETKEDSK